ncbi:MAG: hypothetical protein K0S65_6044, partial [Labilithrix sp.]|nr:hypothetical protein [Labilithrix sp.]
MIARMKKRLLAAAAVITAGALV